jgi:hypothetical protein
MPINIGSLVGAFVAGCAVMWSSQRWSPAIPAPVPLTPPSRAPAPRPSSTPKPTLYERPPVSAEISLLTAANEALRATRIAAGGATCDFPPSHVPDRSASSALPLTDAFGTTLNLESVSRPWAADAPAEPSFGPTRVIELPAAPTSQVFIRDYVHLGQPFVVRRYAQQKKLLALERWTNDYLAEVGGWTRCGCAKVKLLD